MRTPYERFEQFCGQQAAMLHPSLTIAALRERTTNPLIVTPPGLPAVIAEAGSILAETPGEPLADRPIHWQRDRYPHTAAAAFVLTSMVNDSLNTSPASERRPRIPLLASGRPMQAGPSEERFFGLAIAQLRQHTLQPGRPLPGHRRYLGHQLLCDTTGKPVALRREKQAAAATSDYNPDDYLSSPDQTILTLDRLQINGIRLPAGAILEAAMAADDDFYGRQARVGLSLLAAARFVRLSIWTSPPRERRRGYGPRYWQAAGTAEREVRRTTIDDIATLAARAICMPADR